MTASGIRRRRRRAKDTATGGTIVGEVSHQGHRYPAEIIAHCGWLYHRFPLSLRAVEQLMLVRGVIVTYETIRQWCAKFGPVYAAGLRRRRFAVSNEITGPTAAA
jgi:transposase-like protein